MSFRAGRFRAVIGRYLAVQFGAWIVAVVSAAFRIGVVGVILNTAGLVLGAVVWYFTTPHFIRRYWRIQHGSPRRWLFAISFAAALMMGAMAVSLHSQPSSATALDHAIFVLSFITGGISAVVYGSFCGAEGQWTKWWRKRVFGSK